MKLKVWAGLLLVWVNLLLIPIAQAEDLPQQAQLQFVDSYGLPVSMSAAAA